MNQRYMEYGFFAGMAAAVLFITIGSTSPAGYLPLVLLAITGAVLWFTRDRKDRAFYLVCAGEVLAAATAMANPWAGLFVIWMLAGLVAAALGLLDGREDFLVLLLFWAGSLLVAALLQLSDHVVLPLLVLGAGCALVIGFQVIRDYQFRKRHAAGAP